MDAVKQIFIVYAHQDPGSFNAAIKDAAVATLSAQGHNVTVSDLHEMKFNPVGYPQHFKERKDPEHFELGAELEHAAINDSLPDHIANEILKIQRADMIILQFPTYWLGFPAILKGWLDLCFVSHVAFDMGTRQYLDNGLFKDKLLLLSTTTWASAADYTYMGDHGDVDASLWPLLYSFRWCAMDVLPPQIFYKVQSVSQEKRTEMLQAWAKRLESIFTETPLSYIHMKHFAVKKDHTLSDEFLESIKDNEEGVSVGHHMRKLLPSGRKVEL